VQFITNWKRNKNVARTTCSL